MLSYLPIVHPPLLKNDATCLSKEFQQSATLYIIRTIIIRTWDKNINRVKYYSNIGVNSLTNIVEIAYKRNTLSHSAFKSVRTSLTLHGYIYRSKNLKHWLTTSILYMYHQRRKTLISDPSMRRIRENTPLDLDECEWDMLEVSVDPL